MNSEINYIWKRGDGTIFDIKTSSLESKMNQEIHWYDFVKKEYGLIIENLDNYLIIERNGYHISLRKPWA